MVHGAYSVFLLPYLPVQRCQTCQNYCYSLNTRSMGCAIERNAALAHVLHRVSHLHLFKRKCLKTMFILILHLLVILQVHQVQQQRWMMPLPLPKRMCLSNDMPGSGLSLSAIAQQIFEHSAGRAGTSSAIPASAPMQLWRPQPSTGMQVSSPAFCKAVLFLSSMY